VRYGDETGCESGLWDKLVEAGNEQVGVYT